MTDGDRPAIIEVRIPCRPEFVGVARLAILGIASRMHFSYDEVEDVRLAVGEACNTAVERAIKTKRTDTDILIRSEIVDSKLSIEVEDHAGILPQPSEAEAPEELDEQGLGALLMELLVDEFKVEPVDDGVRVKMVKYAG